MRIWAHVLLLVGLACGTVGAQKIEFPGSPVPAADRGEVSGTVVDALSNRPLANARVEIAGTSPLPSGAFSSDFPGNYGINTDSHGHFSLLGLYPGQYVLSVGLSGYVTHDYGQNGQRWPPGRLTVQPGEKLTGLVIRLVPTGVITGRVTDEEGKPMPWGTTSVFALRIGYDNDGNKQLIPMAPSAPAWGMGPGEYRLFDLAPGKYYLEAYYQPLPLWGVKGAVWPRYIPKEARIPKAPKDPNFAWPPILYYPGTMKLSDATQVTVAAGQEISGIDFVIRARRAYRVSGRIAAVSPPKPDAKPEMINVFLQAKLPYYRDFRPYRINVKIGGSFEFRGVMPGSYVLWASALLNGAWSLARVPVVVKNSDVSGLNLAFRPTRDLEGKLAVEGQASLPQVPFGFSLVPADSSPLLPLKVDRRQDGTFVVKGINPGLYRVQLGMPKDWYVKSLRFASQDVLVRPFRIEADNSSDSLDIVMAENGARISGTALTANHHPAADAVVVLVPEGPMRGARLLYKATGADQNGRFALSGIRPGSYELFAWEDVESDAWLNSGFMKQFDGEGRAIELGEAENKKVELEVIPANDSAQP